MQEHLLIGNVGQFALICLFVFSFLSFILYTKDTFQKKVTAPRDILFSISALSSAVAFICLFFILKNHYYEYKYAYDHSNNIMAPKFLLAAIWEGQEGSFLLWLIWNSLLGVILIRNKTNLKSGVMMVISLIQFCLSTMIIGLVIGDYVLGSTPFILFKDAFPNLPFIQANPENYLGFLQDGTGLNPLLQNYWMVIHPPVLFLGFATTAVPFAFAISGMIKAEYKLWNSEALPWTLLAAGVLGLGILMGGAWAYEALSFGGYWAWDPVENASLVPWLTLVAGLHTMLIYKATGRNMRINVLFFLLSFILVLYSTFLTRSGILGDTSVHAFTDLGMNSQLLGLLLIFMIPSLILYAKKYKAIPNIKSEEAPLSREFWMFIGSLILALASVHITFFTSIPVWNKIFGLNMAPPVDVVGFYNKVMIWISILILILAAAGLYMRFKKTDSHSFWKSLRIPTGISIILTILICVLQKISGLPYILMAFATSFGIISSLYYLGKYNKWQLKKGAAAFTHWGFAILMLGVLISSYNKKVISKNNAGVDLNMGAETPEANAKENAENLLLLRQMPTDMGDYILTYQKDSVSKPNTYYAILFEKFDKDLKKSEERFVLHPYVQFNPRMGGIISNPDTRHYLTKDIFTYITKAVNKDEIANDSLLEKKVDMSVGDTIFLSNAMTVLKSIQKIDSAAYLGIRAEMAIYRMTGDSSMTYPIYFLEGNKVLNPKANVEDLKLSMAIDEILVEENKFRMDFQQSNTGNDFVVIKSIIFPYINLVWMGSIVMTLGFILAFLRRANIKSSKTKQVSKAIH